MAEVTSQITLRFNDFSLPKIFSYRYQYQFSDGELNPEKISIISKPYSYASGALLWDEASSFFEDEGAFLYMGNSDLTVDDFGNPNGGTLNGILQFTSWGSKFVLLGFSMDASNVAHAALTKGNEDDKQLLKLMLKGNDIVKLGDGDDYVWTSTGRDTVYGALGRDSLFGNTGNDRLYGQGNADNVSGGAGDDTVSGGWGADMLQGGLGRDRFDAGNDRSRDVIIFTATAESSVGDNRDTIGHFMRDTDDLDLRLIDANEDRSLDQSFTFSGTTARAYSVWYATSAGGIVVKADITGDRLADFEIGIDGTAGLSASNFLL